MEGEWRQPRTVIIEFDSERVARGWYESLEYQEAPGVRRSCSTGSFVLIHPFAS